LSYSKTAKDLDEVPLPPVPVQVIAKVNEPAEFKENDSEPLVAFVQLHSFDAVQLDALVDDHVTVTVPPT